MFAKFFEPSSGMYRYWFTDKKVSLQISRENLKVLMQNPEARRAMSDVDFLEVGGGWYSITEKVEPAFTNSLALRLGIGATNLVMRFVCALNKALLGAVDANPKFRVTHVKRIKFEDPLQRSQRAVNKKVNTSRYLEQLPLQDKLVMLAAKYGRH